MSAPRLLPMPHAEQEARRSELLGALMVPTVLCDPAVIRQLLAEDFANRAAYLAWRDKLLGDAAMHSRHALNCRIAAAEIQSALDAQQEVAV